MLDLLQAGLPDPGTDLRGDDDLSPGFVKRDGPRVEAAVIVPIVRRGSPQVLLTKRSADLKKHAGQISFPGGRIDPSDKGPVDAALRELEEEVAISRRQVDVVGRLNLYQTGTGFDITPIVGLLPANIAPVGNPGEVEEVFEVPLDYLMNRDHHRQESAIWRGVERHFFVIPYEGYNIWGATAGMLVNLAQVVEKMGQERVLGL